MKIALWQATPNKDVNRCLKELSKAVAAAADAQAEILVTPEMYIGGYNIGPDLIREHAEEYTYVRKALCRLATDHNIGLVVGLATPAAPQPYNTCIAINAEGVELMHYHKTHLYGAVDRVQFSAGDILCPIFEFSGWRVGLAICYDIEFPEVARDLALRGADLIITPTANMAPFESVATRLIPARAEENAIYLAYCNYAGTEGAFNYNGLSCVCGPDGQDQARADSTSVGIIYASLNADILSVSRQTQTHLHDRRSDIYGASQ